MSFVHTVAVRWQDVNAGDAVELQGKKWIVKKCERTADHKIAVTVERKGKTFSAELGPKDQALRFEQIPTKPWSEPDTPAEAIVEEVLGASLEAVKLSEGEVWIVPPVDITTIASHMLIYHGIEGVDVRVVGGWEEAKAQHHADHEQSIDDLHVPHRHEAGRPVVDIGPKFH